MQSPRPLLLVSLSHNYAARDFLDTGVLADLKNYYRLVFITSTAMTCDLSEFGPVALRHQESRWRTHVWNIAYGLKHIHDFFPVVQYQANNFQFFQRGVGPKIQAIVKFLFRIGLSSFFGHLLARVLAKTTEVDLSKLAEKPQIALLSTGMKDLFWDDVISACRKANIVSLTTTINWDNIAHKVFLQPPDYLGIWGAQGFLYSRLYHHLPVEKLETLGTPRFEHLFFSHVERNDARQKLGFNKTDRVLLFAGAGVTFDEVSLLEDFEAAHARGELPADLMILYKPHPKRHKRAAEPPLRPETYKRVRVIGAVGQLTPLDEYPTLFAAVDGIITPLSTMMLEGAIKGLPALGLAYNDARHGDFPWENHRLNSHLYSLIISAAHVRCWNRVDFIPAIHQLLKIIAQPNIAEVARQIASFAVFQDGRRYSERLVESLGRISPKN